MTLKHSQQEVHFIYSLKKVLNSCKDSHVTLGKIMRDLKEEGLIFLIAVIALPTSLPIPTPPGFTTIFGIPLCILTIQMMYRLQSPWLPNWLGSKQIKISTFQGFIVKAEPAFDKMNLFLKPRYQYFTTKTMEKVVGLLAFLCSVSIALPILFGNFVPSVGILIMSIGLLYKDGLTVLIGMIVSAIGIAIATAVVVIVIFLGQEALVKLQNFITKPQLGEIIMTAKELRNKSSTPHGNHFADQQKYPFNLPALPYDVHALEPYMSAKTFEFHHGKHHNAYVQNLNNLLKDTSFAGFSLEQVIIASAADKEKAGVFNNAAQVWNHTFFWHSMKPQGGGEPKGTLLTKIKEDFGSYEKFTEQFKTAGSTQFGSGWAWLVYDSASDKLLVIKTANAETPITKKQTALLNCDVWEHAYYIDYQNRRPDYISVFLAHLVNWDFASENFENATKK